jgi:hypothetical protein
MMTRTGYLRVLAPLAGLLAASLSLLVMGQGANDLVCGPSWSTVASTSVNLRRSPPSLATTFGSWEVRKIPRIL